MENTIIKLDTIIKEKNPTLIKYLNEGGGSLEIIDFFKMLSLNITASDDLYNLYIWHNGVNVDENQHCLGYCLFPDYYLMSMAEVKILITNDYFYTFKAKGLVPIFASCGGDYLAIKIDEYNSTKDFKIYYCSPRVVNEENYLSMFDSLSNLLKCIIKCYEEGYYFINISDDILDENFEKVLLINKRNNPLSDYWSSDKIM